MAKQEFAIIYIIFAIVLLASTTQVWRHKDEKSFMMKELFSTALVTVVIYICSLFTNDFYIIAVINTLVFVAEGWPHFPGRR